MRMGTRMLAVAVLEANSVAAAVQAQMMKVEAAADSPSRREERAPPTTRDRPETSQALDRANPPPRRRMTPHCSRRSTPRSPDHSSSGGDDRGGDDHDWNGQKLYSLGREKTSSTIRMVAVASWILTL